jgi:heme-degrading monooxygenase HmoA
MFARLARFTFGAGRQAVAQALADEVAPLIAAQPGCNSVTVFGDDSDGEYGIFVVWDSQANADAAFKVVSSRLFEKYITPNTRGTPDIRLFKVISK